MFVAECLYSDRVNGTHFLVNDSDNLTAIEKEYCISSRSLKRLRDLVYINKMFQQKNNVL